MDKDKWEELCRAKGMVPVHKEPTPYGFILIAEGARKAIMDGIPPERGTHFAVMWAIDRGAMDFAQEIPISAVEVPFQKDRIDVAILVAQQWIQDNAKHGRYDR